MKRILGAALLLLGSLSVQAQNRITPDTGVKWTLDSLVTNYPTSVSKSGTTFTQTDSLELSSSDTLIISEAANWVLDSAIYIRVYGHLIIDAGTDRVTITAMDSTKHFEGFRFEEFSTIKINNAGIYYGGGLRVLTEEFVMTNSTVSYQIAGASTGAAVNFSRGKPVVMNSVFEYNDMPAFASGANQEVAATFMYNTLRYNTQGNSNRPQINMGPSGTNDTTKVIGNTVIGDRSKDKVGGISISSLLGVDLNAIIDSNIIRDNRYGITMAGNNTFGYIRANTIDSNNSQNVPLQGGSGISLTASTPTQNIIAAYNEITNNLWGITLINKANINLGDTNVANYNAGKNKFSGNGNGGDVYALFNNTDLPVQAMNNCWELDTATGLTAEDVINHVNDDPALGQVYFNPVWECMADTTSGGVGIDEQQLSGITFYPNPSMGQLTVEVKEPVYFRVYGMKGNVVMERSLTAGNHQLSLNVPAGIYVAQFTEGEKVHTEKLMVE